jgi:hypothetical protein
MLDYDAIAAEYARHRDVHPGVLGALLTGGGLNEDRVGIDDTGPPSVTESAAAPRTQCQAGGGLPTLSPSAGGGMIGAEWRCAGRALVRVPTPSVGFGPRLRRDV